MNEQSLLNLIRRRLPPLASSPVVLGPGDDCAIFRPKGSSSDWLVTTDMVIQDVHFRLQTHPPRAVGYRVLARGLSDIAAMGGIPRFALLSVALGPSCDLRWFDAFLRGMQDLAGRFGVVLAGGDLAQASFFACDIVVVGEVPRGKALRRDGARPGDQICVSGLLGASACGLRTGRGKAWRIHLKPTPRIELGVYLRRQLGATAAMDLSDGLSLDLHRLALASGLAASLDRLPPAFPGATPEESLHGGEDYELLFTLPPDKPLPPSFRGLPLTRLGVMQRGKPGAVLLLGKPLPPSGFDHFQKST